MEREEREEEVGEGERKRGREDGGKDRHRQRKEVEMWRRGRKETNKRVRERGERKVG